MEATEFGAPAPFFIVIPSSNREFDKDFTKIGKFKF